jgi:hypothetical protein
MTFRARLRRQSAVWHLWENHHRLGGLVCEVQFKKVAPGEYLTEELDGDQVRALRNHDSVLIEAATFPVRAEITPIDTSSAMIREINNHDFHPVQKSPVADKAVPVRRSAPPETRVQTTEERRIDRRNRLYNAGSKRSAFDKYGSA